MAKTAKKKTTAKKPAAKKPAAKKPAARKTTAKKTTAKPSARARGLTVDAYLAGLSAPHRAIAERAMALVLAAAPKATSSIKWGQPVFEYGGPMIWMKSFSKHFGLGFWRGAELPDPKGLLEGDGDRMRHVKLRDVNDIDEPSMRALVKAAAALNTTKGDPTKRG
jgi:hypothetical protein